MTLTETERATLADLTRHPGWDILKRMAEERTNAKVRSLARTILNGEGDVPGEVIWVERGYCRGVNELVKAPEKALAHIERQL